MKSKLLIASTAFAVTLGLSACSESPVEKYLGQLDDFVVELEELAAQDSVCKTVRDGMKAANKMLDPRERGLKLEDIIDYEEEFTAIGERMEKADREIRRKLDRDC
ncbi:hypothetical protein [Pseudidiomarina donghaiensis]|uniref:Lipoprotein n=1 Tax=Pseudidiomarina donghaiensis TaxID=519452 RepID=A0A432XCJ1_9GAMM|nr:hypothetical protein [Pseudidiomarina donghaiensis]RUO46474.1 hypothetical protein CWE24_11205 [Pseudidiomarina donghaiensis]SFV24719.1 hypothetical protein SAMN04488139_2429 [Pseudidiomarina donghaiensis]